MDKIEERIVMTEMALKSLENRTDKLEEKQDVISNLAMSVQKLAINMEHMLQEQKTQGIRLDKLETEPIENVKHYKKEIISCILTTIVGAIIGALIALILK